MVLRKLLVMLLLCPVLRAGVIHVPSVQAPTIQAGISRAIRNDTVLVADGVYTGAGNYNIDLKLRKILLKSEHGPVTTIIDCQGSSSDPRRAFLFWRGEDSNTVVEGFTIRGGYAPADFQDQWHDTWSAGGAISFLNNSSPVIRNCTFTQNYAYHLGGAVLCAGSSPSFVGCLFEDNHVEAHGGAVYACEYSNPEFSGTSFQFNSASAGGAVYTSGEGAVFTDCIISQNSAVTGGGLNVTGTSNVDLIDCVIAENAASGQGGGVMLVSSYGATVSCTRCQIDNNTVPFDGGGIRAHNYVSLTLSECTISGNEAQVGGAFSLSGCYEVQINDCILAGNKGGCIWIEGGPLNMSNSSVVGNEPIYGGAILCPEGFSCEHTTISQSIIAFNGDGEAITVEYTPPQLTCTDIYGNPGGDWTGAIADQLGVNGNISADPMFCDSAAGDYTISGASPCGPAGNTCNALIGAEPIGCDCEDSDGDGYGDPETLGNLCPDDNCPYTVNPDQADSDGDGIGDACDCCEGRVGNANEEGDYPDEVTLGDIMLMVDARFISGDCSLFPCVSEADVNQDGGIYPNCDDNVTLGDIMYLVDFLFITGPEHSTLPECL